MSNKQSEDAIVQTRVAPLRPGNSAAIIAKSAWLLKCFGYFAEADRVVDLYKPSENCMMAPAAFQRLYRPWFEKEGKHKTVATAIWETNNERVNIEGVRMRPDRDFPTYEEGGKTYKNTYRRPDHGNDSVGDVTVFVAFMERFVPDAREREWLYDWISHKLQRPEVPGTCVVFVAANEDGSGRYGTGRGMFFKVMHKLFGEQYTLPQNFNMLDGSSGQHVFNDWMHNNVLVTVEESRTSATAYRKGERASVYELLKDIVDPASKRVNFKVKYGVSFSGMSYCSFMVATNHVDALAIPANDRRFTVLRNGEPMTFAERCELAAWMADPTNLAALVAYLDIDLGDFDMYVPLKTDAKQDMAERAITRVEEAVNDLKEDDSRGLVFTRTHFENAVRDILNGDDTRPIGNAHRGELEGLWRNTAKLLKTTGGRPVTIRIDGQRVKLYCFPARAKEAFKLNEVKRRLEAAKWGLIDGGQSLKDITGG
jgi:hypothetical protein